MPSMMPCRGNCGSYIPFSTWKTTCFRCFKATPKGQAWSAAHPRPGFAAGRMVDSGASAIRQQAVAARNFMGLRGRADFMSSADLEMQQESRPFVPAPVFVKVAAPVVSTSDLDGVF